VRFEMIQKDKSFKIIVAMLIGACILVPALQAVSVVADESYMSIQAKTDRGYYSPGDIIRIKGTVTGEDKSSVQAKLLFQFQGMNITAYSDSDGSFITRVPVSLIKPESMYRLIISAHAEGFEEKNLSIPIVIMGEPSTLAPAPVIQGEFSFI